MRTAERRGREKDEINFVIQRPPQIPREKRESEKDIPTYSITGFGLYAGFPAMARIRHEVLGQ